MANERPGADSFDILLDSLAAINPQSRFDAVFASVLRETEAGAVFFCTLNGDNQFLLYQGWRNTPPDEQTVQSLFCFDYARELLKNPSVSILSPYLMQEEQPLGATALYQCKVQDKTEGVFILFTEREELSETEMLFGHIYSRLCGVISFLWRGIEDKERLEAKLDRVDKLETIGKLADGIAHDVSNLLSGIFGSVAILKELHAGNDRSIKLISVIEQSATRARELTRGLLSYGKPTNKQKETLDLSAVIDEIVLALGPAFPKNIELDKEVSSPLKPILGNSTQMYQVLMNLCVNAKEAMPPTGGSIRISASCMHTTEAFEKKYPFLNAAEYICIKVTDNGNGIPDNIIDNIFEPYVTGKEAAGGTGLGLYISFGIVKAHNGYIEVHSTPGVGTEFTLYFPALHSSVVSPPGEKIVVIVDDEVILQDLLAEMLESYNYDVIKAESGEEALTILHDELKADLIIVDYQMPGMNGMEFTAELRKFNKEVPVILSTGNLTLLASGEPERLQVTRTVPKPYELDTIIKVVEECIGKGK